MVETLERPRRRRKSLGKICALILVAIFAFAINTRSASAHAFLLRTDPEDGSVLLSAPKQMRLWFSESIDLNLTTISLQDAAGRMWPLRPHPDLNDPSAVVVYLPSLPANSYRLVWRTVSDEDLHIALGAVVFGIQQSVQREASLKAESSTPLGEVAFHWIGLLSFATVVGALIVLTFLFPSVRRKLRQEQMIFLSSLQSRMILLALWGCILAFFAGLFMLWEKSTGIRVSGGAIQSLDWKWIAGLLNIVYLKRELASEVCLIVIALLIFSWFKQERITHHGIPHPAKAKIRNILLFSFAMLWICFQALNSHASAFNDFSPTRVIAYALHILGAGLWIGGQVALIFLIAPRLRTRTEQYAIAREIYGQFGYMAVIGVVILSITGIYSGGQQIASVDALLLTAYGQSLIFKSVFVILTGLIGLWHSSLFHRRVARLFFKLIPQKAAWMIFGKTNLPATLRLQLLGGVAIFLLAAFLGSTPPARGPQFDPPVQAIGTPNLQSASLTGMADDLLINFSLKPNRPGPNFINVGVFDTRRPSPGPVKEVVVKFLPPGQQKVIQISVPLSESDAKGYYQISTDAINLAGDWKVSVVIHRKGLEDAVLEIPWSVISTAPVVVSHQTLISNRPLAPVLTLVSILLLVLCGGPLLLIILWPEIFQWRKSEPIVLQKK